MLLNVASCKLKCEIKFRIFKIYYNIFFPKIKNVIKDLSVTETKGYMWKLKKKIIKEKIYLDSERFPDA